MAGGYDGSIKIDTKIDSKGFNTGVKGISAGIGNITGALEKMAAIVGIAFGVRALVDFGKAAVQTASDVEEMTNKFNTVFRNFAPEIQKQLEDLAKATNRSKYDLMQYAATLQDTFVPLGFARDKAAELSVQLVKLAIDLGSFNNIDTATVINDLQAAMTGYTRDLRKYGIVIDDAAIKAQAMAMGLYNGTGEMTAQAKAAAVLQLALKGSADAMGDAVRTSDSYANQVRGLQAAWEDFKVALGQAIIPVLKAIIPYIKNIILWLTDLAKKFGIFLAVFFGIDLSAGVEKMAQTTNDAATAQDKLAQATKAADKAAKGALASWDELSVLQQDTANAATPATPSDLSPTLPSSLDVPVEPKLTDASLETFKAQMEALKAKLIEIFGPFVELGKAIWTALKPVFDDIILPALTWIGNWISEHPAEFRALLAILIGVAAGFALVSGAIAVLEFIVPIVTAVVGFFGAAIAALGSVGLFVVGCVLVLIGVIILLIQHWDEVKERFVTVWTTIQQLWVIAGFWFLDHVVNPIRAAFASVLDWLPGAWKTAFDGVIGWVKGAVNTIIGFINGMISAIVGGINATINAINSISVSIPNWVPLIGGQTWQTHIGNVTAPQIPRLATGAVIPPNAQFAAILGDQKSGRNIEAPEALIRQIVREEAGKMQADVTINFAGSLAQLVRELKPYIDRENVRIGGSLIKGGIA